MLFKEQLCEKLQSLRDYMHENRHDISGARTDMKKIWDNDQKELEWREGIKPGDIIDARRFDGEWIVGKVAAVGNDPTLIVVFFHGRSNWDAENFNRCVY